MGIGIHGAVGSTLMPRPRYLFAHRRFHAHVLFSTHDFFSRCIIMPRYLCRCGYIGDFYQDVYLDAMCTDLQGNVSAVAGPALVVVILMFLSFCIQVRLVIMPLRFCVGIICPSAIYLTIYRACSNHTIRVQKGNHDKTRKMCCRSKPGYLIEGKIMQ